MDDAAPDRTGSALDRIASTLPLLEDLKRSAAFHNTVDVWIGLCYERGETWGSEGRYGEFVRHLREEGVTLRPFQLCVSDGESADEYERLKAEFAAAVKGRGRGGGGPAPGIYTVRLDDRTADIARRFG